MSFITKILKALIVTLAVALLSFIGLGILFYLTALISTFLDNQIFGYDMFISLVMLAFNSVIAIIIGVFLSRKIKRKIASKWVRREILGAYIVVSIFAVFFSLLLLNFGSMFSGQEKIYSNVKDCKDLENHNLAEITQCSGYGIFGFQNNYDYDIRAFGRAEQSICNRFKHADFSKSFMQSKEVLEDLANAFRLHSGHGHSCDINAPQVSWMPAECQFRDRKEITHCYQCARGLSNGNGHRYAIVGFSDNCDWGSFIFLAGWQDHLIKAIENIHIFQPQNKNPQGGARF